MNISMMRINNFDNYPNFDWDLTRNFYFVAKMGIVEASEKLGMTISKLMKKIEALEEKLGFELLLREMPIMPVNSTLTVRGQKLIDFLDLVYRHILTSYVASVF